MSIIISDRFDGGNIEVIDTTDLNNLQVAIPKDSAADFLQWFYFRLEGEVGDVCRINIVNAGESSYQNGWPNYNV